MRGGAPPLDGYVGSSHDVETVRRQQQEREAQRKKFEAQREAAAVAADQAALKTFAGAAKAEAVEAAFKSETVGLVSRAEFLAKRDTLAERIEQEGRERVQADAAAAAGRRTAARAASSAAQRAASKGRPKLSFLDADEDEEDEADDDEDADEGPSVPAPAAAAAPPAAARRPGGDEAGPAAKKPRRQGEPAAALAANGGPPPPTKGSSGASARATAAPALAPHHVRLGKDPSAPHTACLPDSDRERREAQLRRELAHEFAHEQERLRASPMSVTYSYWDGQGHRRRLTVRRGDSVGAFLKAAREQLAPQFRELRAVGADALLFVKEDVILPPHHTFHELIASRARGKSGPLHEFGVQEDLRAEGDSRVERRDVHAGKVVERHWYERHRHIHPYSRWEVWDPENVDYSKPYRVGG